MHSPQLGTHFLDELARGCALFGARGGGLTASGDRGAFVVYLALAFRHAPELSVH